MREVWLRVGGRHALTFRAWLLLAPLSIIGTPAFVPEGFSPGASIWEGLFAGVLVHIVTGLALLPAFLTFLSPRANRVPRPLAAILTFLGAGMIRGFFAAYLLEQFGVVAQADYLPRVAVSAILVSVWFTVAAALVGARMEYLEVVSKLTQSLADAGHLAAVGYLQVTKIRAELVDQVKTTLREAFASRRSPEELHNLADIVVRPLAHSLATHQPVSFALTVENRKIAFLPVLRTAISDFPFVAWPIAVIALLRTLYSKVDGMGVLGAFETVAQALVVAILFGVARQLRVRGWPVLIIWAGVSLIANIGPWQEFRFDLSSSALGTLLLAASVFIPAGFISMLLAYDREATKNLEFLESAVRDVRWQERRLNQQLWIEKKRLARYVHSDIQSRVRAAALTNSAGTLADVKKLERECVATLDLSRELPSFNRFFADTVELWEGVVDISLSADPVAVELLASDSYSLAATVEIVREGIGNAVKHGKAKNIEVEIRVLESDNCLEVSLINDGEPTHLESSAGFGFQTFSEVTSSWGIGMDQGRTRFWARVPISTIAAH